MRTLRDANLTLMDAKLAAEYLVVETRDALSYRYDVAQSTLIDLAERNYLNASIFVAYYSLGGHIDKETGFNDAGN